MVENLVDKYYEQLHKTKYPGKFLAGMHAELTGTNSTRANIIMFNKFVKTFGRVRVFFAILDVTGQPKLNFSKNLYGYYRTVLTNKLKREGNLAPPPLDSLEDEVEAMGKYIAELKETTIEIPELFNDTD